MGWYRWVDGEDSKNSLGISQFRIKFGLGRH